MDQKFFKELIDKHGLNMSVMTFYRHGHKYGFITRNDGVTGRDKFCFRQDKFDEYLKLSSESNNIPDGYVRISDLVKEHKIQYSIFSSYCNTHKLEIKEFGLRKEKYVRREDADAIVAQYNSRN